MKKIMTVILSALVIVSSITCLLILPASAAANLWSDLSADDWYTRDIDGDSSYTDGRDIPEESVSERYGSDFTYNAEAGTYNLKNADGRHYYIKMPALANNKDYTLSFDYSVTPFEGENAKTPEIYKVLLVPKSAFTSEYCWQNTTGEIFADRSWIGIQNLVGGKTPGLLELTADDYSGTVTYEFNSGNYKQYYLFLMFNNISEVTYSDFSLIDPSLYEPVVRPEVDLNFGSVSPAEIETTVGAEIEFTATPLKGNTFEGWYDSKGELLTTDTVLKYTVPNGFKAPKAVFKSGDVEVTNASLEDSEIGLLAYYSKEKNFQKVIFDDNYDVEYAGTPAWEVNIRAHAEHARTGTKSVKIQTQYAYSGRHFKGLEKNTDYAISFWAYIDKDSGLSLNGMVLPYGEKPYKQKEDGTYKDYPTAEALGAAEKAATATSSWQEVIVNFNSGDNEDVTLWFISRGANSDRCWVDDFAIYKPASLEVIADLGGEVKATASGSLPKGSEVTVTAVPDTGNTFKHWLDENGNVVSNEAEYTLTVDTDTFLKAVFGGYNKPARELFSLRGQDGTFENGTISGFYAADPTYPDSLSHCNWKVSEDYAYEGSKSLAVTSYYRNTVLPLTGLNKNTDYKFSYYIKYPYKGEADDWNQISTMVICGENDTDGGTAETIYTAANSYISGDSGWHKIDLYFNTGDATAVNFVLRYQGESQIAPKVYMDNVTLYEYYSNNELLNGDMTDTIAPWLGTATVTDDVMELGDTDAVAYQILKLENRSKYTVTFRAKGEVLAAASDVSATAPNMKNLITSASYVKTSGDTFKDYSFEFYTGVHTDVKLMLLSLSSKAYVDDVKIVKEASAVAAIVEKVDFETDRFELKHSPAYEIYTATSSNDANVHSGTKSLRFKGSEEAASILDEAFLSYGVYKNNGYRITFYYKAEKGSTIKLYPNYPAVYHAGLFADYCSDVGSEHTVSDNGWHKLELTFTAVETGFLKTVISDIVGKTNGAFYIDDLTIQVSPDLVTDPKSNKGYCSEFYSVIKNGSFEKEISSENWKGLPATATVVSDPKLADTGDNFLTLTAGTKYVLPCSLSAGEVYYFAASVKSINGGKGKVSLATDVDPGTVYFLDSNDKAASIIDVDNSDWKHEAFGFRANASGTTYLIIECTSGAIGIDTVSLCLEKHTYLEDPNRYYARVDFDYDNIDPSMIVYNGGFNADGSVPGFESIESTDDESAPNTGDTSLPAALIVMCLILATAVLVLAKKKGGESHVK